MLTGASPCTVCIHASFLQKSTVELPSESGRNEERLMYSPPHCSFLTAIDHFLPPFLSAWKGQYYLYLATAANKLSNFLQYSMQACEEIHHIQNSEFNSGFATADLDVIRATLNFLWSQSDSEGEKTHWTGGWAAFNCLERRWNSSSCVPSLSM